MEMSVTVANDVTITWLGAIGCAFYFYFLLHQDEWTPGSKATVFLVGILTALLTIRGFFWIWGGAVLGRLVFAAATLIPIAATLFTEHLLRRHHPRWLKFSALGVSLFFTFANLVANLASNASLLLMFLTGLIFVLAGNAWFLMRASSNELTHNEVRIARVVILSAVVGIVLAITDFREEIPHIPVRLGALGPMLLVCVLLNQTEIMNVIHFFVIRPVLALAFSFILSGAFALSTHGAEREWLQAAYQGFPVAVAWILLTVIVVRINLLSAENPGNQFLHWLLHARLETAEDFLSSLRKLGQTSQHIVLGKDELAGYAIDRLFEAVEQRYEPVTLAEVRTWASAQGDNKVDAAEQFVDLMEKYEMTHALMLSRTAPLIVLLNLPHGANAAIGHLRAGVIQRVARRLLQEKNAHA